MRKFLVFAFLAASTAAVFGADDDVLVERKDVGPWHLRIGPVISPRVRAKIRATRVAMPTAASARQSSSSSGTGPGSEVAAPSAGFVDREYADGFVKPDEGTDDDQSFISGLTWNWGASDCQSQYSGGKMEFRTDMARWEETVTSASSASGSGSGSDSDKDSLVGVELMGGWTFLDDGKFDAAIDAGFRYYGSGDLTSRAKYGESVTTTTTRNEYRYVDKYDASGWTSVPIGAYEGTAGGPGRLIGATPTRSEELMDSRSSSVTDSSNSYRSYSKLNYTIWDLRLGPTIGWRAMDQLTIRGGVYGLIGLVDAELKTSTAKSSKCEAVFGVAAGLTAQYDLTDNLFVFGGAEYDWWADDVTLKAGGSEARLELSDFTVSLGLGVQF
jgi:hypothetical protein